jgi:hypothetical protein
VDPGGGKRCAAVRRVLKKDIYLLFSASRTFEVWKGPSKPCLELSTLLERQTHKNIKSFWFPFGGPQVAVEVIGRKLSCARRRLIYTTLD